MGDILLYVDDLRSLCAATALCRICHEGEFESSKSLESPCACSGTVKVCFGIHPYSGFDCSILQSLGMIIFWLGFLSLPSIQYAHRDCVQRWCNEKGNTVCEICLQVRSDNRISFIWHNFRWWSFYFWIFFRRFVPLFFN